MAEANPEVDAFFAGVTRWRAELEALRAILLACPVTEVFKWRAPCYAYDGGNVAILWNFKPHCAVGFFKGVLLKDPEGLLIAPGENSRSARMLTFTSLAEVTEKEEILKAYVREAVEVEKAGLKVDFPKDDLDPPEELTAKLKESPELKKAFEALTPGRRRGYLLYFSEPKRSETRTSRIEKAAPRILEGKGRHDR